MKWVFYVIVFVYMFYRAVYGATLKDTGAVTIDEVNNDDDLGFLVPGTRKTISCVAAKRNQKLEWLNPEGEIVQHSPVNRVFVQENMVTSKSRLRVPALVLVFTTVSVDDSGVWTCRSGEHYQNTSLCVIEPARFAESKPVTVDFGRSITLSCKVQGDPEPGITWYRNGELITDNSYDKYITMKKYNSMDSEGLLTIISVVPEDSGPYTCHASQVRPSVNNCLYNEVMNITLQVNYRPVFKENETKIVYGTEGKSVELSCLAMGHPTPTYRWFKDNGETSSEYSQDDFTLINEMTEAVLTLAPNSYDWNQRYSCRATNEYGDANLSYMVVKTVKPMQPSEVQPYPNYNKIDLEVIWADELQFPVDSIDVQYFRAKTLKGRKPKESDWARSKLVELNVEDDDPQTVYVTLPDLDESTEYYFRIRAVNSEGKSQWSKPIISSTTEKPEDSKETTEEETAQVSDSTFYGIFFAGGIVIIAVGSMFLMRMV